MVAILYHPVTVLGWAVLGPYGLGCFSVNMFKYLILYIILHSIQGWAVKLAHTVSDCAMSLTGLSLIYVMMCELCEMVGSYKTGGLFLFIRILYFYANAKIGPMKPWLRAMVGLISLHATLNG